MHREIWLLGQKTSEVWFNSGAADFTFQILPGVFVEHGCAAIYSVAKADLSTFWLGKDLQGQYIIFEGTNYAAKRVSNHALENELQGYAVVNDAIGFTYQQNGHTFYFLTFPTADKTWVYDLATHLWHEWLWTDDNGAEHRTRVQTSAFAYGVNVAGDWETGDLILLDLETLTDQGGPIVRRRGFPHLVSDGDRVIYRQFIADMQVGTQPGLLVDDEPQVSLRWSDTRGASWGSPITMGMGATGQYNRQIQAQRLGMARDRVFELFWSAEMQTALNGAYIETIRCET